MADLRLKPSGWRSVLIFVAVFAALQSVWLIMRSTAIGDFIIHTLTVSPAAAIAHALAPDLGVAAEGSRIVSSKGALRVLGGCEGTEAMFLLTAALCAAPMLTRWRLLGLLCGLVGIYLLNELRIVGLFFAATSNQAWFDLLHGTVAPTAMALMVAVFFVYWTHAFGNVMLAPRR